MTRTIQRVPFLTHEPDVGHAYLRDVYADHTVKLSGSDRDFTFRADTFVLGELVLSRVSHSMAARVGAGQGLPAPTVNQLHETGLRSRSGQVDLGVAPGLAVMYPGDAVETSWARYDADVVVLDDALLAEDAAALVDGRPVTFDFALARGQAAGQHWARTVATTRQVAAALVRAGDRSPLATRDLIGLLNSAALVCFRNSTDAVRGSSLIWNAPAPTPAAVRRATAFCESNADRPIGLTEIAAAARLSPRALQAAFRRHLDRTPLQYLRQVRLAQARAELMAAEPGDGATVARVAARWGWTNAGRFARDYRDAYGADPRTVLRRR